MKKILLISFLIGTSIIIALYLIKPDYFERYLMLNNIECTTTSKNNISRKLNDKMPSYIKTAKKNGITKCKNYTELSKNKKLIFITNNKYYKIDRLDYSYPYLTVEGKKLLNKIGANFQSKLKGTNLEGTKFIVSSLTRTVESVKNLRKVNKNASSKSAHMYGECFDIKYSFFQKKYTNLKPCHYEFLKETLANVILNLKQKKECWALTEINQPCFHIVKR